MSEESGEWEVESEYETEYSDAPAPPPAKAAPVSVAKPASKDSDQEETSFSDSSQPAPATKLPSAVAPVRTAAAPSSTPAGGGQQETSGEWTTEEGEFESEGEYSTTDEAPPPASNRAAPVSARPPVSSRGPAAQPQSARAVQPASARAHSVDADEDEDEWTSEEGYTDDSSSADAADTGTMMRFMSEVCVHPELMVVLQRMFSGDSVARSAVARDLVVATLPTRHCFPMLRNAVHAECELRDKFARNGSAYQDILFHTLVRTGAVFFREALSPTVAAVSQLSYELQFENASHQPRLEEHVAQLLDMLFTPEGVERAPKMLRSALFIACEEVRRLPDGDKYIQAFVATNVIARILADPVGSKIAASVSQVAHVNMGRVAKLVAALGTPDVTVGAHFGMWCAGQAPRMAQWLAEMSADPRKNRWAAESVPLTRLPLKERDLVAKLLSEFQHLKQRFVAQRVRVTEPASTEFTKTAVELLQTLSSGVLGQSQVTMRSVRNPHRKVPHDVHELQREIAGLENFDLASRGRRLFSQGPVVARKKTREEDGHLFLFSDILLYVKHNSPDQRELFTFSRAYRLHQVTVRPLEDQDRAAAAAFCVSAFAQPPEYDMTLFAANARDKDRWVELIRKKQDELRVSLLKRARRFMANEVVKARSVPVELAVTTGVLMKLVPHTDNVLASYDFEQLCEAKKSETLLVLDFNGTNVTRVEDAVVRIKSDRLDALFSEIQQEKNNAKRSAREAVPSHRDDVRAKTPRSSRAPASPRAAVPVVAADPVASPRPAPPKERPPPPAAAAPTVAKAVDVPRTGIPPKDKGELVVPNRPGPVPEPMVVVDPHTGKERDLWDPEKANRVKSRQRSERRFKRQQDRERRAQLRAEGSLERNRRLDEDKTLFMESLERSFKRMVDAPDDSALRRPEELSDREIMRLQRRAYQWKRENKLLKEMLYTQYVCSHNNSSSKSPNKQ